MVRWTISRDERREPCERPTQKQKSKRAVHRAAFFIARFYFFFGAGLGFVAVIPERDGNSNS